MNTNPNAKRILCFGDSNTWGRKPGDDNSARFAADVRWTGILQNLLGDELEIIEEGLNGRTTNLDSPHKAGKNGAKYLFACLESQKPIDFVILQLGKNDLKAKYEATPESISAGMHECLEIIKKEGMNQANELPRIILLSVLYITEISRLRGEKMEVDFLGAHDKSLELVDKYKQLAEEHGIEFIDLNEVAKVSKIDGVHMNEDQHKMVAEKIFEYFKGEK